jgi:formylglycine-generating enzyme required for sulfatase activity
MCQAMDDAGNDVARCVLPPLVTVPAGPFLMGSDPPPGDQASAQGPTQQTLTLAAYQIAVYPLTIAEYACFARVVPERAPLGWDRQFIPDLLDYPVVEISWLDVRAYGQWLSDLTGALWRMPTEAEWEKAARGTDGRLYPWGNEWDARRANVREPGQASRWSPVGAYADAGDASPYGCHDMVGCVWEWTSTIWRKGLYRNDEDHERETDMTSKRMLRGASRHHQAGAARTDARRCEVPSHREDGHGTRLVCDVSWQPLTSSQLEDVDLL